MQLPALLDRLEQLHGAPKRPVPRTPFAWVVWHNAAYLVDDTRRLAAFRALEREVGLDPRAIAAATPTRLHAVAELGGMLAAQRVEKLRDCADIALELGGGDLRALLREPLAKARRALKRFPGIGEPGAEQILLFCDAVPLFALESNGLRVLLRLGYGTESKSYATSYKSAQRAALAELPATCVALQRAHSLLRLHGQTICKRSAPDCGACPLVADCPASA